MSLYRVQHHLLCVNVVKCLELIKETKLNALLPHAKCSLFFSSSSGCSEPPYIYIYIYMPYC
jgi:hypothetical protein